MSFCFGSEWMRCPVRCEHTLCRHFEGWEAERGRWWFPSRVCPCQMAHCQRNVSQMSSASNIPSLRWSSLLVAGPYAQLHWGPSPLTSLRCSIFFLALSWAHSFSKMINTFGASTSAWLRPFARYVQTVVRVGCNAWSPSCSWHCSMSWWISSSEWHSYRLCPTGFSLQDGRFLRHVQSILHAPSTSRFVCLQVRARWASAVVITMIGWTEPMPQHNRASMTPEQRALNLGISQSFKDKVKDWARELGGLRWTRFVNIGQRASLLITGSCSLQMTARAHCWYHNSSRSLLANPSACLNKCTLGWMVPDPGLSGVMCVQNCSNKGGFLGISLSWSLATCGHGLRLRLHCWKLQLDSKLRTKAAAKGSAKESPLSGREAAEQEKQAVARSRYIAVKRLDWLSCPIAAVLSCPSSFVQRVWPCCMVLLSTLRLWRERHRRSRCNSWLQMNSGTFASNGNVLVAVVAMVAGAFGRVFW